MLKVPEEKEEKERRLLACCRCKGNSFQNLFSTDASMKQSLWCLVAAFVIVLSKFLAHEKDFLAWCDSSNLTISTKIKIGVGGFGRGLFAATEIARGEVLMAIPFTAMINIEHAEADEGFQSVVSSMGDASELDIMAGFLPSSLSFPSNYSCVVIIIIIIKIIIFNIKVILFIFLFFFFIQIQPILG